jgi:hypothetical protein
MMHNDKPLRWLLVFLIPAATFALTYFWFVETHQTVEANAAAPSATSVILQFSGVTDDGQKSSSARKEATSILCTNTGNNNASIEVQLFQWSGSMVYTATVSAPPKASYTFSTQNTTIYFDDVIFGTGGGTDAIFQGYGRVLSNRSSVICTAQVLDPLGYPPVFMDKLTMYHGDGTLIGDDWELYMPAITRS